MITTHETLTLYDKRGFRHTVRIGYKPYFGFSTVYHDGGGIIGQVELNKIHQPTSDSDLEWEQYEERFNDWVCEMKVNIIPMCQEFFNLQYHVLGRVYGHH